MKPKRQKKNTNAPLEKTFIPAGLSLIAAGCMANLYSAYANSGFIREPVDFLYYFRYVILLAGGFAAGYLLTKKAVRTRHGQLLLGVTYAALTMAFFWFFDIARVGLQTLLGFPPYPWGKIIFMGIPLLGIAVAALIAYLSQYRAYQPNISLVAKMALLVSFVVYEVDLLVSEVYYLAIGTSEYSPDTSLWSIVSGYLTIPLVIAAVSYFFLGGIKHRFDRLFFAALVGVFYSALRMVLWELHTNPEDGTVSSFGTIVTILSLLFVGMLLWQTRRATGKKPQRSTR